MEFLKKLTGKEIAMIITSVGGILLAAFLVWINWKQSSNHIEHNTQATIQQAVSNEKVAEAINKISEVIDKKLQAK